MRRKMLSLAGLFLVAVLIRYAGHSNGYRAYCNMEEALEDGEVTIVYDEPFDGTRDLVLYRNGNGVLTVTLLKRIGIHRWRRIEGTRAGGEPVRLGALSYKRKNLGLVEKDIDAVTLSVAETHVVFGEILDPAITWVELTPDLEGVEPLQVTVVGGYWMAQLAPENQQTGFELRAGDENGVRFVASVETGRNYRRKSVDPEPLVEYLDTQQGIRLEHPLTTPWMEDGQLRISLGGTVNMYVEQRPELRGLNTDELLQRELAEEGDRVVASGIKALGGHEAAYVLETVPNPEQEGDGLYDPLPDEHGRHWLRGCLRRKRSSCCDFLGIGHEAAVSAGTGDGAAGKRCQRRVARQIANRGVKKGAAGMGSTQTIFPVFPTLACDCGMFNLLLLDRVRVKHRYPAIDPSDCGQGPERIWTGAGGAIVSGCPRNRFVKRHVGQLPAEAVPVPSRVMLCMEKVSLLAVSMTVRNSALQDDHPQQDVLQIETCTPEQGFLFEEVANRSAPSMSRCRMIPLSTVNRSPFKKSKCGEWS